MGEAVSLDGTRRLARRILPERTFMAIARLAVAPTRRWSRRFWFALPQSVARGHQFPEVLAISLTSRCNLRCFICRREGFHPEDLDFENLAKLGAAIHHAKTIDLTGWGEPFLYPRLQDVLDYIYSLNSGEVIGLTTNGSRLTEAHARMLSGHLSYLNISLNAATKATYERDMKYGDFDATLSSIRSFVSALNASDRSKLNLHMVAHAQNYQEIPAFVALAYDLEISLVSVGPYLVGIDDHSRYSLLEVKDEYNRVVKEARELAGDLGVQFGAPEFFRETSPSTAGCLAPFTDCYILPSGEVHPCCYCGNSVTMGNVFREGFAGVWFGHRYRKLRHERHLPACRVCPPLLSFDCIQAHYTADFKLSDRFDEIVRC